VIGAFDSADQTYMHPTSPPCRLMQHPCHSQVCASAPQRASASTSPRSAPADHQQVVHSQPLRSRRPHHKLQVMPEPIQQQGAQQRLPHRLHSPQQQQHPKLKLLSQDSGKGTARQQPEPPTTSGGPPPDVASTSGAKADTTTSSSGSSQDTSADASTTSTSSSSSKPAPVSSVEDEVDQVLDKLWANFKQDLKKELPPDQVCWAASNIPTTAA